MTFIFKHISHLNVTIKTENNHQVLLSSENIMTPIYKWKKAIFLKAGKENIGVCVKGPEIEDTERSNDSSESTSSSVSEREYNDATKRVASWIMSILKSEDENMEMEEDNISGEEDTPRCACSCKNCVIL